MFRSNTHEPTSFSGIKEVTKSVTATLGNRTTLRCSLEKNSTMHIKMTFKPGLYFNRVNKDLWCLLPKSNL